MSELRKLNPAPASEPVLEALIELARAAIAADHEARQRRATLRVVDGKRRGGGRAA